MARHAITQDGLACLEFNVRKWRDESANGRPEELKIQVSQNNESFVTEVRIWG